MAGTEYLNVSEVLGFPFSDVVDKDKRRIQEYISNNAGNLQAHMLVAVVYGLLKYGIDDKAMSVLSNVYTRSCKTPSLNAGKNTVAALIGPYEPVLVAEDDEITERCVALKHRLHSCSCVEASECACIIDGDTEKVCTGCDQCMSCCGNDDNCFACDSCGKRFCKDNVSSCSNCERCEECCSSAGECYWCEGCSETGSSSCSNCEGCDSCCNCWHCGHCSNNYASEGDTSQCELCERCDGCCSCYVCSSCGNKNTKGVCGNYDCESCKNCCECAEPAFPKECTYCGAIKPLCVMCGRCKGPVYSKCCRCKDVAFGSLTTVATQKAKGMRALSQAAGNPFNFPPYGVYKASDATQKAAAMVGKFVRPCPMTPRHGFVDSRVVNNIDEVTAIINETLAADPQAEMVVMNCIKATHSAVWTPGVIVIGPGHDGATAGHGSFTVPVGGDMLKQYVHVKENAGIKDSPYMEILWTAGDPAFDPTFYAVQLRDGPAVPQQVDYVAEKMVVANVIAAGGDLLEWETKMKNQPAGTVVHHPGGSLASHYAVHAMLNHIPVMVSHEPKVGDILLPISGDAALKPNMADMRTGFYFGVTAKMSYVTAAYMMLAGCHNTVLWLGKQDLLLGVALGCCYRLSLTAGLGEWRYKETLATGKGTKEPRTAIYSRVWDRIKKVRGLYLHSLKDFRQLAWSSGIGGEKWFQFTHWAAVMFNAVRKGDATAALEAMNQAVHSSHNNGWGFNKFVHQNAMTEVANIPASAFRYCGPLAYLALTEGHAVKAAAKSWFKKRKPYPTHKMNKWLDMDIPLNKALFARIRLGGDKIVVQASNSEHSKAHAVHAIDVPEAMLPHVRTIFEAGSDGRVTMPSLKEGDDHTYFPVYKAWDRSGVYFGFRLSSWLPKPLTSTFVDKQLIGEIVIPTTDSKETLYVSIG